MSHMREFAIAPFAMRLHRHWTEDDCANVLFTYKIRFSLSHDSRRQLIWREMVVLIAEKISRKRTDMVRVASWYGQAFMVDDRTDSHYKCLKQVP